LGAVSRRFGHSNSPIGGFKEKNPDFLAKKAPVTLAVNPQNIGDPGCKKIFFLKNQKLTCIPSPQPNMSIRECLKIFFRPVEVEKS